MKILNGLELVGFIKERQAHQVRSLRQSKSTVPKLAIIRTNPDPVVDSYMRLKQTYGSDIGVEVDVVTIDQSQALTAINDLNTDPTVYGIIVQIPIPDPSQTTQILNAVSLAKDVDGLAEGTTYDAPTPIAINWLLAGYNIGLEGKNIVIVGHVDQRGRLEEIASTADAFAAGQHPGAARLRIVGQPLHCLHALEHGQWPHLRGMVLAGTEFQRTGFFYEGFDEFVVDVFMQIEA